MFGGTVIIDDTSDAGAWHTHIAHVPALRAQCPEEFPRAPSGCTEDARIAGGAPSAAGDTGGSKAIAPIVAGIGSSPGADPTPPPAAIRVPA